jgi:hypothetical protein
MCDIAWRQDRMWLAYSLHAVSDLDRFEHIISVQLK